MGLVTKGGESLEQVATDPLAMDSWHRELLLEALEAFRKGVSEAPLLRKWSESGNLQAAANPAFTAHPESAANPDSSASPDNSMSFVLSTDEVDRHGDVIATGGWNLKSYRKNPVFLWAHDYARPVIGRAVETWLEPHRLLARVEFAPTGFAQEVAGLYQAGYQRGVSVGFKPLRFEERRDDKTGALVGIHFLEQELLEVSAVPVPANRSALRRALNEAPLAAEYLLRFAKTPENSIPSNSTPSRGTAMTTLEAMWGVISARIDDLAKQTEELVKDAAEVEKAAFGGQGYLGVTSGVPEMLATLPEILAALKVAHR